MSTEQRLRNLFEAMADDIDAMSDEDLIEELRENGEDPDEVAERTRKLLMDAVDAFNLRRGSLPAKEPQ
jgi:hypothetical protein